MPANRAVNCFNFPFLHSQIESLYSVCVGCDKGKYIVGDAVCRGMCPHFAATPEDRANVLKLHAAALDLRLRLLNLTANTADTFFFLARNIVLQG